VSSLAVGLPKTPTQVKPKSSFAYKAVLALSILYYARPEDVIPGLGYIPMAKIAGGLALIALIFGMKKHRTIKKLPLELKLLLVLFVHLCLTIPFAFWRGGAFETVFLRFSKGLIVAILVSLCVSSIAELKKLFWVQAASLAFMTLASILAHKQGRMTGVLGGIFENPNDLAINIAINFPFCFAFLIMAKKWWKKILWALAMFVMTIGTVLTYSRSGFLAIILCGVISLYQFGIKGRRMHLIMGAGTAVILLAVVAPVAGLYPKVWMARMETIFADKVQNSMDNGSKEARTELLKLSLEYMSTHPIFGVGPGNFASFSGSWLIAHNTYTELGAEAGLPALFLFVLILGCALVNLGRVAKSELYKKDPEVNIFTGAMLASWGAFVVGAAFSDTQYELFPYFMIAYTTVLYHMACVFPKQQKQALKNINATGAMSDQLGTSERRKPEYAWTR
jgi:putative inorganic carbon (hco3(-)) transporter